MDCEQPAFLRLQHNHPCGMGVHKIQDERDDAAENEKPRMHPRKAVGGMHVSKRNNHLGIGLVRKHIRLVVLSRILHVLHPLCAGMAHNIKLPFYGTKAYRNISFEREAYECEGDNNYLENGDYFEWVKYIF